MALATRRLRQSTRLSIYAKVYIDHLRSNARLLHVVETWPFSIWLRNPSIRITFPFYRAESTLYYLGAHST